MQKIKCLILMTLLNAVSAESDTSLLFHSYQFRIGNVISFAVFLISVVGLIISLSKRNDLMSLLSLVAMIISALVVWFVDYVSRKTLKLICSMRELDDVDEIENDVVLNQIAEDLRNADPNDAQDIREAHGKIQLPHPELISFEGIDENLLKNAGTLYKMWTFGDNTAVSDWVDQNLNDGKHLAKTLLLEFQNTKHQFIATSINCKSQRITGSVQNNVPNYFINELIPLMFDIPELQSNLHKIVLRDITHEQFLNKLHLQQLKFVQQYEITNDKMFVILLQRIMMIEIIYFKTLSWQASHNKCFYVMEGNDLKPVIISIRYLNVAIAHRTHDYNIQSHYVYDFYHALITDELNNLGDDDQLRQILINNYNNNLNNVFNQFQVLKVEELESFELIGRNLYAYQVDELRKRTVLQGIRTYVPLVEHRQLRLRWIRNNRTWDNIDNGVFGTAWVYNRATNIGEFNYVADFRQIPAGAGQRRNNANANDLEITDDVNNATHLLVYGMKLNTFIFNENIELKIKYQWLGQNIGYRSAVIINKSRELACYSGRSNFRKGIRRINKIQLYATAEKQRLYEGMLPNNVEVEWINKDEYNDHTYAHNLARIKRTELFNGLQKRNIVLEVGSNLDSQIYTNGMIVNLATKDCADTERKLNLRSKMEYLLNLEQNRYLCVNYLMLNELDLTNIELSSVVMHNVLHNINLQDVLEFILYHPNVENIETLTYLPSQILFHKNFVDDKTGMLWHVQRGQRIKTMFHESDQHIIALMPAGDPLYQHTVANLYDYFATKAVVCEDYYGQHAQQVVNFEIKSKVNDYIRMRIIRSRDEITELNEALFTLDKGISQMVIQVKQSLFGYSTTSYTIDAADTLRMKALLQMAKSETRGDLLASTRIDNQYGVSKLRFLNAIKHDADVQFVDEMIEDEYMHSKNVFIITNDLASMPRKIRTVKVFIEESENYRILKNSINYTGHYTDVTQWLSNTGHNVNAQNIANHVRDNLIDMMIEADIIVKNAGKVFASGLKHEYAYVIENGEYNFNVTKCNSGLFYEENVQMVSRIVDLVNLIVFKVRSHSDEDCVNVILKDFGYDVTGYKGKWNIQQICRLLSNNAEIIIHEEEYYKMQVRTNFEEASYNRPINYYQETAQHAALRLAAAANQNGNAPPAPPLPNNAHERVTYVRRNNAVMVNRTERIGNRHHNHYQLIYGNKIQGNYVNAPGAQQPRIANPAGQLGFDIILLIVNGHVYQVMNHFDAMLDAYFTIGLTAEEQVVEVGLFQYGGEECEVTGELFLKYQQQSHVLETVEENNDATRICDEIEEGEKASFKSSVDDQMKQIEKLNRKELKYKKKRKEREKQKKRHSTNGRRYKRELLKKKKKVKNFENESEERCNSDISIKDMNDLGIKKWSYDYKTKQRLIK